MNALIEAFASGVRVCMLILTPKIQRLENQVRDLEEQLLPFKGHPATTNTPTNRITFTMKTTDDNQARIKVAETDRLGVTINSQSLSATVSPEGKATVEVDPADPSTFVVTRLPITAGDPDILTVTVTVTDAASGLTGTQEIEFDPGKATTMQFDTQLEPVVDAPTAPPAVGDTITIAPDPENPSAPSGDHTVTAVSPDGAAITAEPVTGGDAVTVPADSVTPAS